MPFTGTDCELAPLDHFFDDPSGVIMPKKVGKCITGKICGDYFLPAIVCASISLRTRALNSCGIHGLAASMILTGVLSS